MRIACSGTSGRRSCKLAGGYSPRGLKDAEPFAGSVRTRAILARRRPRMGADWVEAMIALFGITLFSSICYNLLQGHCDV
jgi:hypothetical protein